MNAEERAGDDLGHEPILGAVRGALAHEPSSEIEHRMRRSLSRFRNQLRHHPYTDGQDRAKRARGLFLLTAGGLAAAGLVIAAVFLLGDRPGGNSTPSAAHRKPLGNGSQSAGNAGPAAVGAYPVAEEIAENQIIWWATSDNRVVAVWEDGTSGCWDVQTGAKVCQFTIDHFNPRYFRCFVSPTNPTLVVVDVTTQNVKGDLAKSIRLYDLRTGGLLKTLKPAGYPHPRLPGELRPFSTISAAAVSRDGRYLLAASAGDKLVFAIDLGNGKTAWYFRNEDIPVGAENVLFAPDGKTILIVTRMPEMSEPMGMKKCIAYSSDGQRLWDWSTSTDNGWLLVHKSAGAGRTAVFSLVEIVRDARRGDTVSRCIGLSAAGAQIWQYDKPVLAISADAVRRVVADTQGREGDRPFFHEQCMNVPVAYGPTGMAFTADGTHLLRLPNLTCDWREQRRGERRIVLFRRTSNMLRVTVVKSGELWGEIALAKPSFTDR